MLIAGSTILLLIFLVNSLTLPEQREYLTGMSCRVESSFFVDLKYFRIGCCLYRKQHEII